MLRFALAVLIAAAAVASTGLAQSPGTCVPPGTPTCDPNGVPVPGGPGGPSPDPGPGDGGGGGGPDTVATVNALASTVALNGGRPVRGAEGIALDPSTGLVYLGLQGTIITGCEGDASRGGTPLPPVGSAQMSIVDPTASREIAVVPTGQAPIWPTVDPNRRVVYMQDRDLFYFSAVGDGAIVAVNAANGQVLYSGVPKSAYGAEFGGNNMLARQVATRRLFQVNTQRGKTGILVADEITLTAEKVIGMSNNAVPWGMSVDEPNRLLFAALPNSNAVAVVDLDTRTQVASIPVGVCPYAVVVDPERRRAVTSNQGTPTQDATASILNLCPVYAATNRIVAGCSALDQLRISR